MDSRAAQLGRLVAGFTPPPRPNAPVLSGPFAGLERFEPAHCADLFEAFNGHDQLWDYMPYGPFHAASAYHRWGSETALGEDPYFYAIRDLASGHVGGVASYLNIVPAHGSIEIGHICLSPSIAGTRVATDALAQMVAWAFGAGYRRVEWKCNALNIPSRRAAQRLGFSFEGVFRNHLIVKGRNRDTAWFAITDADWPALSEAYAAWLAPSNFDPEGVQIERLSDLTQLVCTAFDPVLIR
ncbi:MAG: GNAT family protein [Cypionkella sp.]|nr:GNAT family protein [Cypionkella sp.]